MIRVRSILISEFAFHFEFELKTFTEFRARAHENNGDFRNDLTNVSKVTHKSVI